MAVIGGVGALVVSAQGTLTPDEKAQLDTALMVVMAVGAGSIAGFALSVVARERAARRGGARHQRLSDLGIATSAIVFAVAVIAGPIGIAVHAFCPLETRGDARFRPDGGRVGGSDATIQFHLPTDWRMRYGRQSWREGTALDGEGVARFRVSIGLLDAESFPHRDGALVGYVTARERAVAGRSSSARTLWRQGPRGREWVLKKGGKPNALEVVEIATPWGARVLTVRFARIAADRDFERLVESLLSSAVLSQPTAEGQ